MILLLGVGIVLRAVVFGAAAVALENVALRHQVVILQRSVDRPRLRRRDRIPWACLARLWPHWRSSLLMVQPATMLAWHRQGFQLYWRWNSRAGPVGRPPLAAELRQLIQRMARENPTWAAAGSRPNWPCSGTSSPPLPSPRTCAGPHRHRRRRGGHSWRLISATWWPSTSLSFPRSPSAPLLPMTSSPKNRPRLGW